MMRVAFADGRPRRRRLAVTVGATAAACCLLLTACSSSDAESGASGSTESETPSKSAIRIGVIGGFSGPCCTTSADIPTTVKGWAKWINAKGGLNGHPVKVFVVDDKADPATAAAGIRQLVENDKVIAIVSSGTVGLEGTWADYVNEKNIPVVGGLSYTPTWDTDPMFFPSMATVQTNISAAIDTAKNNGGKVFSTILCAEQAACAQVQKGFDAAVTAAGMEIGYNALVPATAPNYTAQCVAAKSANVDSMALSIADTGAVRFATDCQRQGFEPQYIFGGSALTPTLIAAPALDGALASLSTFPWFYEGPETEEFNEVLDAAGISKEEANAADAVAFLSAQLFAKAMANAPENATSQDVLDGLYTIKDETLGGLGGPYTFSADDKSRSLNCYWVAQIKDGEPTAPQGLKSNCLG